MKIRLTKRERHEVRQENVNEKFNRRGDTGTKRSGDTRFTAVSLKGLSGGLSRVMR